MDRLFNILTHLEPSTNTSYKLSILL